MSRSRSSARRSVVAAVLLAFLAGGLSVMAPAHAVDPPTTTEDESSTVTVPWQDERPGASPSEFVGGPIGTLTVSDTSPEVGQIVRVSAQLTTGPTPGTCFDPNRGWQRWGYSQRIDLGWSGKPVATSGGAIYSPITSVRPTWVTRGSTAPPYTFDTSAVAGVVWADYVFTAAMANSDISATFRDDRASGQQTNSCAPYSPTGRGQGTINLGNPLPQGQDATFTVDATLPAEPARRVFRPTVTSGRHEWSFGDGATSDSFLPDHVYAKPGDFVVTHCRPATDVLGRTCASQTVTVEAPELGGAITMTADGADQPTQRFDIGQEFDIALSIGAGTGVGAISAVDLDPDLESLFDEETLLEVLEEPDNLPADPTEPLTFEPDTSASYTWRVKALRPGRFGIATTATAKDAAGRSLDPVEIGAVARIGALKVEVVLPDAPVQLEPLPAGEDGESAYAPAMVPVTVKVTVPSSKTGPGDQEQGVPVERIALREQSPGEYLDFDEVKRVASGFETSYVDLVPQPVPMPARVTTSPDPTTHDGVVQPGESVEFHFMTQIDEPGAFEALALVEGRTVVAEDQPAESVTGSGSAVLPVGGEKIVQIEYGVSTEQDGTPTVQEGDVVYLEGTVRNLSPDDTVALDALTFRRDGPGVIVGPGAVEQRLEFPGARPVFAPALAPQGRDGDEADFRLQVHTAQLEGIDSSVLVNLDEIVLDVIAPTGVVTDEDGEERELDGAGEVLVDVQKGRVVDDGRERARIGVTRAPPAAPYQLGFTDFLFTTGGLAAERFVSGAAYKAAELPGLVVAMGPAMKQLGQAGVDFTATEVQTYTQGALYMLALYDYRSRLWLGMDTSTQEYLVDQVADELFPLYQRQMKTRDAMRDFVDSTVQAGFAKADEIAARGGRLAQYGWTYELAELYAEPARTLGGLAVEEAAGAMTSLALSSFAMRMTRSSRVLDDVVAAEARVADSAAAQVADAVDEGWARGADPRGAGTAPRLSDLPGGTALTPAQAIRGWAIDATSDQNLRALTSKADGMPIVVAIRSRADETIQWMADHVGIELKPVTFKPKNVDWADTQFLGYRSGVGYGVGDRGATVLAEPLSRAEVVRRVGRATDLTPAQRAEVLERHGQRWKEWYGVACPGSAADCVVPTDISGSKVSELKELAATVYTEPATGLSVRTGRLDVPRRGHVPEPKDNWDTAAAATVYDSRRFEMRQVPDPEGLGREYYETWLAGRDGVMRRIAGDIDVVMVTDTSGRTLTGEMAERTAIELQRKVGAQHPWSSTLSHPELRREFLEKHRWSEDPAQRGEPLLIYMNGESKVGWFDPSREIAPDNPLDAVVWLDGGAVDADLVVQFQRQSRGLDVADVANRPGYKPSTVKVREALEDVDARLGGGSTLAATCKIISSRPAATFAGFRYVGSRLEKRNDDGTWSPAAPETACASGEIAIVPDTASLEALLAGQIRIPIIDELFGVEWKDLFRIGDCVTIEAGTTREESACVVQHGSLILDRPLRYDHPARSQILIAPAGSVAPAPAPDAPFVAAPSLAPSVGPLSTPRAVRARVRDLAVVRRAGRRALVVDVAAQDRVATRVRVRRDGALVRRRSWPRLSAGRFDRVVWLPQPTGAGRLRVTVVLTGADGSKLTVRRWVRAPSP